MIDKKAMRDVFEQGVKDDCGSRFEDSFLHRYSSGEYMDDATQYGWEQWNAALAWQASFAVAQADSEEDFLPGWTIQKGERYWTIIAPDGVMALARDEDSENMRIRVLARLAEAIDAARKEQK